MILCMQIMWWTADRIIAGLFDNNKRNRHLWESGDFFMQIFADKLTVKNLIIDFAFLLSSPELLYKYAYLCIFWKAQEVL